MFCGCEPICNGVQRSILILTTLNHPVLLSQSMIIRFVLLKQRKASSYGNYLQYEPICKQTS